MEWVFHPFYDFVMVQIMLILSIESTLCGAAFDLEIGNCAFPLKSQIILGWLGEANAMPSL